MGQTTALNGHRPTSLGGLPAAGGAHYHEHAQGAEAPVVPVAAVDGIERLPGHPPWVAHPEGSLAPMLPAVGTSAVPPLGRPLTPPEKQRVVDFLDDLVSRLPLEQLNAFRLIDKLTPDVNPQALLAAATGCTTAVPRCTVTTSFHGAETPVPPANPHHEILALIMRSGHNLPFWVNVAIVRRLLVEYLEQAAYIPPETQQDLQEVIQGLLRDTGFRILGSASAGVQTQRSHTSQEIRVSQTVETSLETLRGWLSRRGESGKVNRKRLAAPCRQAQEMAQRIAEHESPSDLPAIDDLRKHEVAKEQERTRSNDYTHLLEALEVARDILTDVHQRNSQAIEAALQGYRAQLTAQLGGDNEPVDGPTQAAIFIPGAHGGTPQLEEAVATLLAAVQDATGWEAQEAIPEIQELLRGNQTVAGILDRGTAHAAINEAYAIATDGRESHVNRVVACAQKLVRQAREAEAAAERTEGDSSSDSGEGSDNESVQHTRRIAAAVAWLEEVREHQVEYLLARHGVVLCEGTDPMGIDMGALLTEAWPRKRELSAHKVRAIKRFAVKLGKLAPLAAGDEPQLSEAATLEAYNKVTKMAGRTPPSEAIREALDRIESEYRQKWQMDELNKAQLTRAILLWTRDHIPYRLRRWYGVTADDTLRRKEYGSTCSQKAVVMAKLLEAAEVPVLLCCDEVMGQHYMGLPAAHSYWIAQESKHIYVLVYLEGRWYKLDPSDDLSLVTGASGVQGPETVATDLPPHGPGGLNFGPNRLSPESIVTPSSGGVAAHPPVTTGAKVRQDYREYVGLEGLPYFSPDAPRAFCDEVYEQAVSALLSLKERWESPLGVDRSNAQAVNQAISQMAFGGLGPACFKHYRAELRALLNDAVLEMERAQRVEGVLGRIDQVRDSNALHRGEGAYSRLVLDRPDWLVQPFDEVTKYLKRAVCPLMGIDPSRVNWKDLEKLHATAQSPISAGADEEQHWSKAIPEGAWPTDEGAAAPSRDSHFLEAFIRYTIALQQWQIYRQQRQDPRGTYRVEEELLNFQALLLTWECPRRLVTARLKAAYIEFLVSHPHLYGRPIKASTAFTHGDAYQRLFPPGARELEPKFVAAVTQALEDFHELAVLTNLRLLVINRLFEFLSEHNPRLGDALRAQQACAAGTALPALPEAIVSPEDTSAFMAWLEARDRAQAVALAPHLLPQVAALAAGTPIDALNDGYLCVRLLQVLRAQAPVNGIAATPGAGERQELQLDEPRLVAALMSLGVAKMWRDSIDWQQDRESIERVRRERDRFPATRVSTLRAVLLPLFSQFLGDYLRVGAPDEGSADMTGPVGLGEAQGDLAERALGPTLPACAHRRYGALRQAVIAMLRGHFRQGRVVDDRMELAQPTAVPHRDPMTPEEGEALEALAEAGSEAEEVNRPARQVEANFRSVVPLLQMALCNHAAATSLWRAFIQAKIQLAEKLGAAGDASNAGEREEADDDESSIPTGREAFPVEAWYERDGDPRLQPAGCDSIVDEWMAAWAATQALGDALFERLAEGRDEPAHAR